MDLINCLEKNENARKIFGKREIIIIKKQLLGIKLTQSEKNRLSRDIRRKLRFIKEISKFEDNFDLKKGAKIKKDIENIKESILESEYSNKIKRIILFGSTATNQRTIRSDIDIAVEFDRINPKEATKFSIRFSHDEKKDIKVYNILPDKIKIEINKYGREIWKKEI